MKVFVSQPMHTISGEQVYLNQTLVRSRLLCSDHHDVEIIDNYSKPPAVVNDGRIAMLGHSIMLMKDADLVVFTKGWENSKGCCVEMEVCKQYGLKVMLWDELFPPDQETK